jgi:hypothetical protein
LAREPSSSADAHEMKIPYPVKDVDARHKPGMTICAM